MVNPAQIEIMEPARARQAGFLTNTNFSFQRDGQGHVNMMATMTMTNSRNPGQPSESGARDEELDSERRARMLKGGVPFILFDFLLAVIMVGFLLDSDEGVKECSLQLYWVGWSLFYYQVCFVLRGILLLLACSCTKQPDDINKVIRIAFNLVDAVVLSGVLVWAVQVMLRDETTECKDESEDMG